MARIVFEVDIAAPAAPIVTALTARDGIASWWTDSVDLDGGVGSTMRLGFPIAPLPFELRIDEAGPSRVAWSSVGDFPPHWVGTSVTWTLTEGDGGTKVHFDHDGFGDDGGPFPMTAYTWGQLLGVLKGHVETGAKAPMFTQA